jgi:hypothetical protein
MGGGRRALFGDRQVNHQLDLNRIWCVHSLQKIMSKCEFCKNWLSDSDTLLKDINEFVPVHSRSIDQCGWNSRQIPN